MQIAQAVDSPGARWKVLAGPLVLFACTLAGLWLAASVSGSPALSASAFAPAASPTPCTSQDYSVITSTGATLVPGVVDTGNHCDDCPTTITLPFPYVFYGIPYTMVTASSNGNLQFTTSNATYLNECLPESSIQFAIFPHWTDMLTNHADGGIFTSVSGTAGSRIFNIEWRAVYLSDFSPVNFEVRLYEGVSRFDIVYGTVSHGGSDATVGVERTPDNPSTQFECDTPGTLFSGLQLTFLAQGCSTPLPTATPATCGTGANYGVTISAGAIVPGTILVPGSQADDGIARISFPFPVNFYDSQFTGANVNSNGTLQFSSASYDFFNVCLPSARQNNMIAPYWDDLDMSASVTSTLGVLGVYTSVSGVAPNRIFNIEWRACLFGGGSCGGETNFEVRLYEGSTSFDIVYGILAASGQGATVGVQRDTGSLATLYECNTGGLSSGTVLSFAQPVCPGSPTPTPVCQPQPQTIGLGSPGASNLVRAPSAQLNSLGSLTGKPSEPARSASFSPLAPITFMLDDGARDTSAGFGSGVTTETAAIWLNRFTPGSGNFPLTINEISLLWPTQVSTGTLEGKTARLLVYQDADGDNNPANATLLGQQDVTIGSTESFESYPVNIPVTGPGDIYIGFEDLWAQAGYSPRLYPASLDSTNPRTRSWVAANSDGSPPNSANLGSNDLLGTSDVLGLPGNWMIRASGTAAGNCPSATPTPNVTVTPTSTSTASPTPAQVIVGHVTWQGRPSQPNVLQQLPITLTLRLQSGGPDNEYTGMTTDASGFFTASVSSLPLGAYNWRVKGPKYLANSGSVPLTGAPSTQVEMGGMRPGDSNNDNRVTVTDFGILKATFGKAIGDPGYDDRGDFNGDNRVNVTDFNQQKSNFGFGGAPPIGPSRP